MAARAGSSPVQVVARATRFRTLRNTLLAMAAVIATAITVTATVVWPVGQRTHATCAQDETSVTVRPFVLSLGVAGGWLPTGAADHTGGTKGPVVTGCVNSVELTPVTPDRTDGRG